MANSPKLVRYPDRGRLLVAADLHGNLRDFLAVVARFEGMGDDAHLLFLGDLLHGPLLAPEAWPQGTETPLPLRGRPYRDESPAILLGLQLLADDAAALLHDQAQQLAAPALDLDQLDLDIVALERDPSQKDVLARVFRTVQHSWHPAGWGEDGPWLRMFRNARKWLG